MEKKILMISLIMGTLFVMWCSNQINQENGKLDNWKQQMDNKVNTSTNWKIISWQDTKTNNEVLSDEEVQEVLNVVEEVLK